MSSLALPASLLLVTVVSVAVALVLGVFVGLRRATGDGRRALNASLLTSGLIGGVLAAIALAFSFGLFQPSEGGPPKLVVAPLVVSVLGLLLLRTPTAVAALSGLPLSWVVALPAFRVPVEWMLWALHRQGLIPARMTFEGYNFDVLVGASAALLAIALSARKPWARRLLPAWNVANLSLLLVIVFLSVASAPGPQRLFHEGPPNRVVADFPFVWLPGFLVPVAFLSFFLIRRRLRLEAAAVLVGSGSAALQDGAAPSRREQPSRRHHGDGRDADREVRGASPGTPVEVEQ